MCIPIWGDFYMEHLNHEYKGAIGFLRANISSGPVNVVVAWIGKSTRELMFTALYNIIGGIYQSLKNTPPALPQQILCKLLTNMLFGRKHDHTQCVCICKRG